MNQVATVQAIAQFDAQIVLDQLRIISGTNIKNHATLILIINGKRQTFTDEGNGPIDAICKALKPMAGEIRLTKYRVDAQGEGSDALAKADVIVKAGIGTFAGLGFDPNTDVAGARAIIDAINKLKYYEQRNQ